MKNKLITPFYSNNIIETLAYLAYNTSRLPHQTKGSKLYHEKNFPLKLIEDNYYHVLRNRLIGKPIGYEHIYFDQI